VRRLFWYRFVLVVLLLEWRSTPSRRGSSVEPTPAGWKQALNPVTTARIPLIIALDIR